MSEREFVLLVKKSADAREYDVLPVPSAPSSPIGEDILLEPVELQRRHYLLMLQDRNADNMARHNGQAALPVTLLRVKDEVRTAAGTFFVSSRRGQSVFPPQEEHLGIQCPLCSVPIEKDTLLYACGCGTLLHCEDETKPEDQRLECARMLSSCPKCRQPIDFSTGLTWEPAP
jgi:hypothetical protein